MTLPVAILAGGLASRLGAATRERPKSLLDVAGKPFVVHQLEWLRLQGYRDIVLCIGHLGAQIRLALGDGAPLGVRIRYADEGEQRLGTGGALRGALPLLGDAFLVMYGDSLLACDLAAIEAAFVASGAPALMTVFRNDGRWDRSNVEFDGTRIRAYDKMQPSAAMRHIDYGLGAFRRRAFAGFSERERFDLAELYQDLLARGWLDAFEVHQRFYEIGSPQGLAETRQYLEGIRV